MQPLDQLTSPARGRSLGICAIPNEVYIATVDRSGALRWPRAPFRVSSSRKYTPSPSLRPLVGPFIAVGSRRCAHVIPGLAPVLPSVQILLSSFSNPPTRSVSYRVHLCAHVHHQFILSRCCHVQRGPCI